MIRNPEETHFQTMDHIYMKHETHSAKCEMQNVGAVAVCLKLNVRTARRNQMQTRENSSRSRLFGSEGSKPEKSDTQPNTRQRMVVQKMGRYLSIKCSTEKG